MTLTLILAIGVPISALMSTAALRRLRPRLAADIRGIALQTVIIIVVMLLIAGGVSAVLLSRGGEAIGELEAASTGRITEATCPITKVGADDTGVWDDAAQTCTWGTAGTAGGPDVSAVDCAIVNGVHTDTNNGGCVVTIA